MILAGGRAQVGLESTVVSLVMPVPTILRPGGVTKEDIESVIGAVAEATEHDPTAPHSPGMLASHYAPNAAVRLNATSVAADEALLAFGRDCGVTGGAARLNLSPTGDLHEAAANLFVLLRELDRLNPAAIAVMPIPEHGLGVAINDRLRRASFR